MSFQVLSRFVLSLLAAACAPASSWARFGEPLQVPNSSFEEVQDGTLAGWSVGGSWRAGREGLNGSGGLVWSCDEPSARQETCHCRIPLKERISCRVLYKVKTVDLEADRGCGFMTGLEFMDAGGKRLGGSYQSMPFARRQTDGWADFDWLTPVVPDGTRTIQFCIYMTAKCRGRVAVDDVCLMPVVRDPVVYVTSSAYRDEAVRGKVGFHAYLQPPLDVPFEKLQVSFLYTNAAGRLAHVSADFLTNDVASVTLDVSHLAMGPQDVRCAVGVRGDRTLGQDGVRFTRVATLPKRRVRVDAHKRLIVDGKPFFPHGMYGSGITKEQLDRYCEAPFNVIMPYTWDVFGRETLDLLQSRKVMLIQDLHVERFGSRWAKEHGLTTQEAFDASLRGIVRGFRDHPALLAWYLDDETNLTGVPQSVHCYRILREEDPDHPVWSVCERPDKIRSLVKAFDIAGGDPYPFAGPIRTVAGFDREMVRVLFGDKPFWNVTQAFWLDWQRLPEEKARVWRRFPTADELRCQNWTHLAYGAKGLLGYWFVSFQPPRDAHEGTAEERQAAWADVCETAREVDRFIPVFLSVGKAPSVSGGSVTLPTRTWLHGGRLYVLAVNCSDEPAKATLTLSAGDWRDGKPELGTPARLSGARTLLVRLPPHGVSFTSFKAK